MKRIISVLLAVMMLFVVASCAKNVDTENSGNEADAGNNQGAGDEEEEKLPDVVTGTMIFAGLGEVKFELYPNVAPQSALNFIYRAQAGHYNGVIVDRLVKDYVLEAGDFYSGYVKHDAGDNYTIKGEFGLNGFDNPLSVNKGAIAWVTTGEDYDSAHTEFAIYLDEATAQPLKGTVAVFGYIVGDDSLAILDKINKRKTYGEKPNKEIMISSVVIDPIDDGGYEFPVPDFIKH